MAAKIVKDSASWSSLWVKTVNLGSTESALPGGSAAASINQIVKVGNKIGVTVDVARLREDGNYYAQIDTAALVRISGTAGTAGEGATVYMTSAGAINFTASGNTAIGYLDEPKTSAGQDIWVQLVPGLAPAA